MVFIILAATFFAFTLYMCSDAYTNSEIWNKITTTICCLLAIGLLIGACFAYKDAIRIKTINNYFDGKIEVVEQVDTVRTYKFN